MRHHQHAPADGRSQLCRSGGGHLRRVCAAERHAGRSAGGTAVSAQLPAVSTGKTREKIYLVGEDGQSIVARCEAAKPGLFAEGERLPVRERAARAPLFAHDYVIHNGAAMPACRSCWRTGHQALACGATLHHHGFPAFVHTYPGPGRPAVVATQAAMASTSVGAGPEIVNDADCADVVDGAVVDKRGSSVDDLFFDVLDETLTAISIFKYVNIVCVI